MTGLFSNDVVSLQIEIGAAKSRELMEQLTEDCRFLARHNVMDYSLLLGIFYADKSNGNARLRRESDLGAADSGEILEWLILRFADPAVSRETLDRICTTDHLQNS